MQDAKAHNIIPGQEAYVPVKIITTKGVELVSLVTKYPTKAYPEGTHFMLEGSQVEVMNGNAPKAAEPLDGLGKFLQKHFAKDLNHELSLEQNAIRLIQKLTGMK